MQKNTQQMGTVEWLMLLSLSFLWGSSFINMKNALTEVPAFTLVFLRLALAFLGLFIWCLFRKKNFLLSYKTHMILLGNGLLVAAIPFSFFTWGQQHVSSSMASVFNGCVPFFVAILAHFFMGDAERMTYRKALGLLMGFSGIVCIMGFDVFVKFDMSNMGQLAIIIACFFYGLSSIYFRKIVPDDLDKTLASTYTVLWAALVMAVVSYCWDGLPTLNYSASSWTSLLMLAWLSTALAYVILFRLIRRAGLVNTSLNTFIIPVFGIALGVLLMGDILTMNDIFGTVLIFIGVAVIQSFDKFFIKKIKS